MSSKYESDLVKAIDEKKLFDAIMPAIKAVVRSGGGADAILRKSEPLAAVKLIEKANSDDDGISLKASIEILNRTQGRPVERSVNLYGDISRMNEADVDNQIRRLLDSTGAKDLIETTLSVMPPKKTKRKAQARKPRKSDPRGEEGRPTSES